MCLCVPRGLSLIHIFARKTLVGVVVVSVALAVTEVFHQLGGGVEDVLRGHQAAGLLGGAVGGTQGLVGGVGFGGGGQVEHGLGDAKLALGGAQALVGVPRGEGLHQSLRVGEADVLGGEALSLIHI